MPRIFRSLRFRLLLIVLLALTPAFGLALYNASQQRHLVQNQVQEDALDIAQSLANHQNELVEGARQMLFVLAQLPVIRGDDDLACKAYPTELKAKNPRYMNIIKWDLDGNMLCDAANSPLPHKSPFPDHLEMVLDSMDFVINGFVISPHTNERALSFGYPVLDENGQPQNILLAPVHLDSLNPLLTQADLPTGSTITLRDGSGTVLARFPQPGNWVGEPDPDMKASPALAKLPGEGTLLASGADGVQRLYAYTPVYSPIPEDLTLIVGIPYQDAMGAVELTLERSLFILALAGSVALIAIWLGGEFFFLRPIQKLLGVTRRMAAGDLAARAQVTHEASELSELALSFDQMAEALEKRENECLQAQNDLLKQERDRARLLHQVITANEDERLRISRELHDETSQNLTALMLGLDTAGIAMQKDPLRAREHFKRVKSIAEDLLTGTHRLVNNLRPPLLDDLGLAPAIQSCADRQFKPQGITLHLEVENPNGRLPQIIETAVFRIVQEAFTNISRHAQAGNVFVHIEHWDDELLLEIQDDGLGFDPSLLTSSENGEGFGLRGMQERVRMLNGSIEISTAPGEGTQISAHIPILKSEGVHG